MAEQSKIKELKKKTAVVILAYADYESLELALATHARFSVHAGVDIYVLQNGRGSYDCERTYTVAKRYHYLYPETIFVVDDIRPGKPFDSLRQLFGSEKFQKYEHIIKLDDDVLVLTPDWIDRLCACYLDGQEKYGEKLAYATTLVNNNPYGFKQIIEASETLAEEYFSKLARRQYLGHGYDPDAYAPNRIVPKERICSGSNGTIWRYPYIARWLHEKTTLQPEKYIDFASGLGRKEINNKERYSINCMIFEKKLWTEELEGMDPDSKDDEHLLHAYCLKYNKKILADLSIPMVHLFFFSQREECKDMIDELRKCYTDFLQLEFPIPICGNRLIEIENRLRFLEEHKLEGAKKEPKRSLVAGGLKCVQKNGLWYTLKYIPKRLLGK